MLPFMYHLILAFFLLLASFAFSVELGIDVLLSDKSLPLLKDKKIGIITNQTAVNKELKTTVDLLKANAGKNYKIVAIFAPEHGYFGRDYANQEVDHEKDIDGIPIYSLHGKTRRPSENMLEGVSLLIYDIQDVGSRSYTYITTLFYMMEEAAKKKIPVIVLDRPNPINGVAIDGPMLEKSYRSMVGYINVPYCYGMTIGELAHYFNKEYKIRCDLEVIPMQGWNRSMSFRETGLPWVPTSPYIPECDTPLYYPITGALGELSLVNIGIGYTLPFKLIGAPWINAIELAKELNQHGLSGVYFTPFFFRPFYGKFKSANCQGVLITVTDPLEYKPFEIQFQIITSLKKLYPEEFKLALKTNAGKKQMFCKVIGTDKMWDLLNDKKNSVADLKAIHEKEREEFLLKRKKYLNSEY